MQREIGIVYTHLEKGELFPDILRSLSKVSVHPHVDVNHEEVKGGVSDNSAKT